MLIDALVLACLSTIGLVLAFKKLPRKVRRFLAKHALLTDFLTFVLTYFTLGGSLTALTAGAMVAIFTSVMLHVIENPNDYLYLWDLKKMMDEQMKNLKDTLSRLGKEYREGKEITTD